MSYTLDYLEEVKRIAAKLDLKAIDKMVEVIFGIRKNKGRLFFLRVGDGGANAAHAVNDFRKIAGIEAYAPTDNVADAVV